ncbi:sensor histidine kinase [Puerhibacterium puerhi]|uniref:sensor histidine kinase n=1 Tax=Puerhibacterium puerhi TaxID=2692623 RepID=UPI0013595B4A|nr:sensor histidine kinase [Puerhibacterium puerhi]
MTSAPGVGPHAGPQPAGPRPAGAAAWQPAAGVPFLRAPFHRRAWAEHGYLWLALLLAPFGFAYAVATVALGAGLGVTVVGLFVVGALVLGGRGWAALYRGMGSSLLDTPVAAPLPYVRPRGFWRSLGAPLADAAGWRALLFLAVTFPVTLLGFVLSTTFLVTGLGATTHWIWSRWLPAQQATDGTWHRGAQLGPDWFVDTPPRQAALAVAGVLVLLAWPWVTHVFAQLLRVLTRTLLGPTRASLRVAELHASRAGAVEDAEARLRRIERDLHDGTQARLVAVAMQLGEAREQLTGDGDPALAADLLGTAHASTKEALTELREIARGIHPPALDSGLAVALETLAARAPLPVTVDCDGLEADDLSPAVEAIAYFTVAELLTNAAKHARATGVYVLAERRDHALVLRVRDDGRGGAAVASPDGSGRRTGLAGLVERVRSVDGTFDLSSPVGGPTVVTVTLPTRTQQ